MNKGKLFFFVVSSIRPFKCPRHGHVHSAQLRVFEQILFCPMCVPAVHVAVRACLLDVVGLANFARGEELLQVFTVLDLS
mgnify:CR=1 FL=1